MQLPDHSLELVNLHPELSRCGKTRLGRKKAKVAVTPIIVESLARYRRNSRVLELVKLVDRHELNAIDTKVLDVRNLVPKCGKGTGMFVLSRRMRGKSPNMHLVDDQIFHGDFQGFVVLPVKVIIENTGTVLVLFIPVRGNSPLVPSPDHSGVRIHKVFCLVEAMPFMGIERTIHAIRIIDVLEIKLKDNHRIHIADPELFGKRNDGEGLILILFEQYQFTGCCLTGKNRELIPSGAKVAPKGRGLPTRNLKSPWVWVGWESIRFIVCLHGSYRRQSDLYFRPPGKVGQLDRECSGVKLGPGIIVHQNFGDFYRALGEIIGLYAKDAVGESAKMRFEVQGKGLPGMHKIGINLREVTEFG